VTNQPGKPQAQAQHLGDALVAAERRDLAEHLVAVGTHVALQVLREAPRLAEHVLARRRVGLSRRRLVRHRRTVPERPHVLASLHAQGRVDDDAPPLVERQAPILQHRVRLDAGRPDERMRLDPLAPGQRHGLLLDALEGHRGTDLDPPPGELPRPGHRERPRDGAEREDEPLVSDLERPRLRLDVDRPRRLVERGPLAQQELGMRAHHAQRHDHVARLERARRRSGRIGV
jgi:hypothetical protein